jgi:ankyrin repeat protein
MADAGVQFWVNKALYVASDEGHTAIVDLLLKAGAEVDTEEDGCTPLLAASSNGHTAIVQQLLQARAEVNNATEAG